MKGARPRSRAFPAEPYLAAVLFMKKNLFTCLLAWVCILSLLISFAGCTLAPAAESSADPTSAPTASPTAAPTTEPTAEPTPEPTPAPQTAELTGEVEAMYPLLQAHVLAQLNGGTFHADDPQYFWQTVAFAIDGCGMDFYTAETVGSALVLSRGVIEEIASGLFENGGAVLLEIPESLTGDIQYDTEADAFAHPLNESGFTVSPEALLQHEDGTLTLTAALLTGEDGTQVAAFTAVLVQNARSGNSLFTLSVRSLTLQ